MKNVSYNMSFGVRSLVQKITLPLLLLLASTLYCTLFTIPAFGKDYDFSGSIGDIKVHMACANGIDKNPCNWAQPDDSWELTITNTSQSTWTEFVVTLNFKDPDYPWARINNASATGFDKKSYDQNQQSVTFKATTKDGGIKPNGKTTIKLKVSYSLNAALPYTLKLQVTGALAAGVKLQELASPDSAEAGLSYLSVTGSGFPYGNMEATHIIVQLALDCQEKPIATTHAASIVSASSDSNLVSFLVPSGLAPGTYYVSISDREEGDANFESSNCSEVNVTN